MLTVAEAARALNVSQRSLYQLAQQKKIRHYRIGPKRGLIRFDASDLEAYRRESVVEV